MVSSAFTRVKKAYEAYASNGPAEGITEVQQEFKHFVFFLLLFLRPFLALLPLAESLPRETWSTSAMLG